MILFSGPSRACDFSRRDPLTSLFAVGVAGANLWNEGDNLGPPDYESVALASFVRCHYSRNQCEKMKPKYTRGPIGSFSPSEFIAISQSAFTVSLSALPTAYSIPI